ncbi:hypothetical protein L249_2214 [Ophiocordyceps polyrhachis-furcata BCC 54312]|uniref:Chromosome transmission fidelity protein 8 n=1 Tax=Ophiocordyceps polyrhachis-furcata BCC 54312 TaxID=1330021 RepID=A0A367LR06_9HYPO|nr:hypothetical protein L249_2214 [Ophiocordyceps polyrhachis-furcata BCC 54312]
MTPVKLHPRPEPTGQNPENKDKNHLLPQLLQTPSGIALLELQGTVNLPAEGASSAVEMGRLEFPDDGGRSPTRRVHLYVGQHQRLTGEVKKLPKALAVVRRRPDDNQEAAADLEVVEIVKYKLVFSNRPEPVGTVNAP